MKRAITALMAMCLTSSVLGEEILPPPPPFTGWHWYNEPKKAEEPEEPPQPQPKPQPQPQIPDFNKLSAVEQVKVLHGFTMEALNKAILYPSSEHTATFLRWQKFWLERSSMFSQSFAVAQLNHPDLDYNLEYPHYNSLAPFVQTRDQQAQQGAIKSLSEKYGLFYFYRGADPIDTQMAGVVADFARTKGIALIAVSVDGQVAPTVPDSRPDNGQSQSMGITYFPALFLVDPVSKNYKPLAYGFMTQDDLGKRFLNVATDFKPNF